MLSSTLSKDYYCGLIYLNGDSGILGRKKSPDGDILL